jgi:hypothetical protein
MENQRYIKNYGKHDNTGDLKGDKDKPGKKIFKIY